MEPKNHPRPHSLPREPGRRYAAGRVLPRAGADIRRTAHQTATTQAAVTPEPHRPTVEHKKEAAKSEAIKPALPRTSKSLVLRRQMAEHAKAHKKKVRRMHRRHMVALGIALTVVTSVGVLLWAFQDALPIKLPFLRSAVPEYTQPETKVAETSTLDETPVTKEEIAAHKMTDDTPRVLHVPKLDLEARVRRVGASLTGDPVSPESIYDVGWFEQNGKPGAAGAVLINGHSVGPTKNGIFANLRQLQPGDQVLLELGNGSLLTYSVVKVQEYQLNQLDMEAAKQSLDPTKKGLNLITTSNRYSSRSENSRRQLIVFTQQVN